MPKQAVSSTRVDRSSLLCGVARSAIGAKVHYEIWWAQVSDAAEPYYDKIDEHSAFFRASRDAHYMAFFIYLGHLFDRSNDACSLKEYEKLLSKEARQPLDEAVARKFREFKEKGDPIRKIRNKTVAHINSRLSETDVFGPLNMTWNEIRKLIYDVTAFVAELQADASEIPRDGHFGKATLKLFRALR